MYKWDKLFAHVTVAGLAVLSIQFAHAQNTQGSAKFPGIGRNATPALVAPTKPFL